VESHVSEVHVAAIGILLKEGKLQGTFSSALHWERRKGILILSCLLMKVAPNA